MVIILKKGVDATQVENLKALLKSHHITPRVTAGTLKTIIGCVGDITHIDPGLIEALDGVNIGGAGVMSYDRMAHPDNGSRAIYDQGMNVGRRLHMSLSWAEGTQESVVTAY